MDDYAIFGAGGAGRQVMPLAREALGGKRSSLLLSFVDDGIVSEQVNGHEVLTYTQWLDRPAGRKFVCLAVSDGRLREQLAERCRADSVMFFSVHASNAVMLDEVSLGEGSILSAFVTLTSNIQVGRHFYANHYSHVAHDCIIGDYVTFAPGVRCNGNVIVRDYAYVGTGAMLRQGTPDRPLIIGKGAVVGMGAVVTKDVPDGAVVVGNPAKPLVKS